MHCFQICDSAFPNSLARSINIHLLLSLVAVHIIGRETGCSQTPSCTLSGTTQTIRHLVNLVFNSLHEARWKKE